MFLLRNALAYISMILVYSLMVFAQPIIENNLEVLEASDNKMLQQPDVKNVDSNGVCSPEIGKVRVKRQDDAGRNKFIDATKMSQLKTMRVFLQNFKNLFAPQDVGGSHPLSAKAVAPAVKLFKERIMDFVLPDVGPNPKFDQ